MALHTGNWTHWSWPSGLVWLNRISAWVRPVTRRTATGALRPLLARSERILAVCETAGDNSPAVASTRALYYRGDDNADEWTRIGWEELHHATWHPEEGTLALTGLAGSGRPPVTLYLSGPGRLPEVSRDRIAAAVVATSLAAIDPGGVRITARRRPGTDDLVWTVQTSRDLDPADPDVRRRVDIAIRTMRTDLGV